ncbi:MAG: phosphoadenosine phosphosulfate reductase family protein, partial [Candidatus Hydrogenedentes bacterium]|nr:phosphoadenosine phosphosulfate reductase family protein [Candidatus Hydrogenedentota bacterium]
MYSYTHDPETGGLLLNFSPTGFSKEPRPVYAPELDILGFDKYWKYDKQTDLPYMWAEANQYIYRGKVVARLKGGNLYTAPEINIPKSDNGKVIRPEPRGKKLRPINIEAMTKANRKVLQVVEQTTIKKILNVYKKYKAKLDCFHVAFSGGKDSLVLLDLVKKALPKRSFLVLFGDTGMEFLDTYKIIRKVKEQCIQEDIPFYSAESRLSPEESWNIFGPPSRVLRWCCSVHKSAPQTLKLREITGKEDYKGLAFVGVRGHESNVRSHYKYLNTGEKTKGQYSHNSILEWTSAEVWLYIFAHSLLVNEAYKKGSARVGCLCCPMGGGKSRFIEYTNYKEEVDKYLEIIKTAYGKEDSDFEDFILKDGWSARKNGRDLIKNKLKYTDTLKSQFLTINISNQLSNWKEWMQTIVIDSNQYKVEPKRAGLSVEIKADYLKNNPLLGKYFKHVFHKTACCQACGVCVKPPLFGPVVMRVSVFHERASWQDCMGACGAERSEAEQAPM